MSFLTTQTETSVFLGSDAETHDSLYLDRTNQPTTTPHSLSYFDSQDALFDTLAEAKRAMTETGVDEYMFVSPGTPCDSLADILDVSNISRSTAHIPPITPLATNAVKHHEITTETSWRYLYALITSNEHAPATYTDIDPELIERFIKDYHREHNYTHTTQPDIHFTLQHQLSAFADFLNTGNTPEATILNNTITNILDTHTFHSPASTPPLDQQLTNTDHRCKYLLTHIPETREAYIWIARLNRILRAAITSQHRTTIVFPRMNPLLEALATVPLGHEYFQRFLTHCALNNTAVHCCITDSTNLTSAFNVHALHDHFGYLRIYDHCTALHDAIGIPDTHTAFLHDDTSTNAETTSLLVTHTATQRDMHQLLSSRSIDEAALYPTVEKVA